MEVSDIKFRGKRIDNGEWIYGDLTRYSKAMSYITEDLIEDKVHQVHTSTVCQYIGLKDLDGVEIYKDDIVEVVGNYKPGRYVVVWDSYRVAWWGENIKHNQRENEHDNDYIQLLGAFQDSVRKVIGNLHDQKGKAAR